MFGWGKTQKRLGVAAEVAASLPERLNGISSVECATILILSNCFLQAVANRFNSELVTSPSEVSTSDYNRAINEIYPAMEQLTILVKHPDTARRRHVECHRLAMTTVFCSLAMAKDSSLNQVVKQSWKILWQSKANAPKAVSWIRDYEAVSGVEATPRNQQGNLITDEELLEYATIPSFLRKKR